MEYKYPQWSKKVIGITFSSVTVLLTAFLVTLKVNEPQAYWVGIIVLLSILIPFLYMPRKIGYTNDSIYIQMTKGKILIPFSSIKSIAKIETKDIHKSFRIFGSGGLFGYLGHFKNKQLGHFRMYATSEKELLCIETNTKKYVVNCMNADEFIRICFEMIVYI